ncbi:transposase [Pelomonas sp. V22]|uniref:transposase n=1 Tax=Pelomonas sp. V22 TaxID=2822139 RepID=UPI0024A7E826|nr:transposase [Pelomonas sp. V22]MDI4635892.1 transposase [Pelomonas sp. V22]
MQDPKLKNQGLLPADEETLHHFRHLQRRRTWETPELDPQLPPPWHLSDALWAQLEPLVAVVSQPARTGRPSKPDRIVLEGIFFVLKHRCAWKSLPNEPFGSSSAIHLKFKRWYMEGLFEKIWEAGLAESAELEGIAWRWYYKRVQDPTGCEIPVFLQDPSGRRSGHAIKVWRPEIPSR